MDGTARIEQALAQALAASEGPGSPPRLAAALRHAVFPGGARIRPRLCVAVAAACGEDRPALTDAAAASIELLHCASLVHDDLPCFDDAPIRRGRPSVHRAFGERIAVLAGDTLIVLAFETLGGAWAEAGDRLPRLLATIAGAAGAPRGIAAGQAWECEPCVVLADYQQAKTGALFAAATVAGAQSAGRNDPGWRLLGERLGEAYQVADDLKDAAGNAEQIGKPVGRDVALDRPSAVRELGIGGALARLKRLVADALDAVPACPGAAPLRAAVLRETLALLPDALARRAA